MCKIPHHLRYAVIFLVIFLRIQATYGSCEPPDYFECASGDCIKREYVCNNITDCPDNSDEDGDCGYLQCKEPNWFQCDDKISCIRSTFKCDGENDCPNGDDEIVGCPLVFTIDHGKKILVEKKKCSKDEFQCTDKSCIPQDMICDGYDHCKDGSDESRELCEKEMKQKACEGFQCDNFECIDSKWVCDGSKDCKDGSDESQSLCTTNCTMDNNKFLCSNGSVCIDIEKVCDSKNDCGDNSDEGGQCNQKNSCDSVTCQTGKCVVLPTGPTCPCKEGFSFDQTTKSCQDIDECSIFGKCDQGCINTVGSYKCTCFMNFELQSDFSSCKVVSGDPTLVFSDKKNIYGYKLHSHHEYLIAGNIKQGIGVSNDGHHVYWTQISTKSEAIVRSRDDGTEKEVILTVGIEFPEDIEIDYMTGNIYFSDSSRKHIAVCSGEGYNCVVLINDIVERPRAIALYPSGGIMYWTDWGERAYIGVSFMDGKNAKKLITEDLAWPNGLALDWPNGRLYWVDAKVAKIESARIDGTDRRVVLKSKLKHPYGLAVFENRLFWSDWEKRRIQSVNKFTGKNRTTIVKSREVFDINIYHPATHPVRPHPCIPRQCSHLCLLSGNNTYSCGCPESMTLSSDLHECRASEKKVRLLMGAGDYIINMPHETFGRHAGTVGDRIDFAISKMEHNSLKSNYVFIADNHFQNIYMFDVTTFLSTKILSDHILDISDMAYDYLANNLYWADAEKGTIEVLSLNTNKRTIVRHFLGNDKPVALAVSSDTGYMYVVQQSDEHAHIDKFPMNGGEPHIHLVEDDLGLGYFDMAVDEKNAMLYWSDSYLGRIERIGFDGRNREVLYLKVGSPMSLTLLENNIYWIGSNSKSLYMGSKVNQTTPKKITIDVPSAVGGSFDVQLAGINSAKVSTHKCMKANGGCSHICISNGPTSRSCLCPTGMIFRNNENTTCRDARKCEFKCGSGECIENSSTCDGKYDCIDASDEKNCTHPVALKCAIDEFECSNGKECIPLSYKCDRHFDCSDRSDERPETCENWNKTSQCHNHQIKCSNGLCLDVTSLCDGHNDCGDNSDEKDCNNTVCGRDKFRCLSGQCVFKHWECDGVPDCRDGSDEHTKCPSIDCPKDYFRCKNGQCIHKHFHCDGNLDCPDMSDESNCNPTYSTVCSSNEMQCSSNASICLDMKLVCDGTANCPRGEDEIGCGSCNPHEFQCENQHCIRKEWVCDKENDCGDGSDEKNCTAHPMSRYLYDHDCVGKYSCQDGTCLDYSKVCDKSIECKNGIDEGGLCDFACKNHPCTQKCKATPQGPMCSCDEGYSLDHDKKTCSDINECLTKNPCSQICRNTVGSYQCSCYSGFALTSDKVSCKSSGEPKSMLYTTFNEIRNISNYPLIFDFVWESNETEIQDIDVDVRRKLLYFIMKDTGNLYQMDLDTKHITVAQDVGDPTSISLDWITGNVYYADISQKTRPSIKICNMHHRKCVKIMQLEYRDIIQDIVVDPVNKYLFVASLHYYIFNMPTTTITKTRLDGSRSEVVMKSVMHVTGLAIDVDKQMIYFTDFHTKNLQQVGYSGDRKKILVEKSAAILKPIAISVFENTAFVLNMASSSAAQCKLYGKVECNSFDIHVYNAEKIQIVQESMQKLIKNNCEGLNCSVLCIPADSTGTCVCQNGDAVEFGAACGQETEMDIKATFYKTNVDYAAQASANHSSTTSKVLWSLFGLVVLAALVLLVFYFWYHRNTNRGVFNVSMYFQNPLMRNDIDKSGVKMQSPEVKMGAQHNEIVNKAEYENLYNIASSIGLTQTNSYALNEFSDVDDEDDAPLQDAESCDNIKQRLII